MIEAQLCTASFIFYSPGHCDVWMMIKNKTNSHNEKFVNNIWPWLYNPWM
jgi:hypothetical protein